MRFESIDNYLMDIWNCEDETKLTGKEIREAMLEYCGMLIDRIADNVEEMGTHAIKNSVLTFKDDL